LFLAHLNNASTEFVGLGVETFGKHSLLQLLGADRLAFDAELFQQLLEAGGQDRLVFSVLAQDFFGQLQVFALGMGHRFGLPRRPLVAARLWPLAAPLLFRIGSCSHCSLLCAI